MVVLSIVALVFATSFAMQMSHFSQLPSAYDPGIALMDAFKTSEKPILIEFYSDECSACQQLTPILHTQFNNHFKNDLTLAMVDVYAPQNSQAAQLFGVETIPAIFIFDAKHMKKATINIEDLRTEADLRNALNNGLAQVKQKAQQTATVLPN